MSEQSLEPRSRRTMLAASLGAVAGLAAAALGRPGAALAADDDPLTIGVANIGSSVTSLSNTTDTDDVLRLASTTGRALKATTASATRVAGLGQATGGGVGLMGVSGGIPATPAKVGVYGYANQDATAVGVQGKSVMGYGVRGTSTDGYGMLGVSTTNVGVYGLSDSNPGVYGASTSGSGVRGVSASSNGVSGESAANIGVYGKTASGVGVRAEAASGLALQTVGRVAFGSSGLSEINAGTKSRTVTPSPAINLTAASKVLVTLMGNPGGTVALQRVSVSTTANTFTVYLTGNAGGQVKFAWFVIG